MQPHVAFFGEKDFQQLFLIKKMVKDFNLKVKIVGKLSVILDQRIIDVLNKAEFKDFKELKDIKMTSSISKYIDNKYQY